MVHLNRRVRQTVGKATAYAIVRVFGRNGTVSTKQVEITGIPVEGQAGE